MSVIPANKTSRAAFIRRAIVVVIITTVVMMGAVIWVVWGGTWIPAEFWPGAAAAVESHRQEILVELAQLKDHDWAGKYFQGDGLGENVSLVIAPQSGFAFVWHGCLGTYDQNYGPVAAEDNVVTLYPRFANRRQGFHGIATNFHVVRWGERRYLIANDEMIRFCNEINQGREPRKHRFGFFLLREGDWDKAVTGTPSLPKGYEKYLLHAPIVAEITAVGRTTLEPSIADFKFKKTDVTLGVGKKDGVLPGTEFESVDSRRPALCKVTNVAEQSCEATITQVGEENDSPQVGWKFSTRTTQPRNN